MLFTALNLLYAQAYFVLSAVANLFLVFAVIVALFCFYFSFVLDL